MALVQFDFKSEILGAGCSLNAVINQRSLEQKDVGHRSPVLYLLHGLSGDHTSWLRRSSIERYAEEYDVVVVMPDAQRSFYTNMRQGYRYFDFIADELPRLCQACFPISAQRKDTFVAGLSMGGYGAFKLALTRPQQFAAAASLSGALDLRHQEDDRDAMLPEWQQIFGSHSSFENSENDLLSLATRLSQSQDPAPKLFQCCGTEDYLYPSNQSFLRHSRKIGLAVDYEEEPGAHDWGYWDRKIQRILEWLPLERLENNPE